MTEWSSLLESLYVIYCMYQELQLFLLSVTRDTVLIFSKYILKYFFCSVKVAFEPRATAYLHHRYQDKMYLV